MCGCVFHFSSSLLETMDRIRLKLQKKIIIIKKSKKKAVGLFISNVMVLETEVWNSRHLLHEKRLAC